MTPAQVGRTGTQAGKGTATVGLNQTNGNETRPDPVRGVRQRARSSLNTLNFGQFVEDQTRNGRKFKMWGVIDDFSRECVAMVPLQRFRSNDVIDVLADLFIANGLFESDLTTAVGSRHMRRVNGWTSSASPRSTSSQEVPGRMDMSRALTPAFAMTC